MLEKIVTTETNEEQRSKQKLCHNRFGVTWTLAFFLKETMFLFHLLTRNFFFFKFLIKMTLAFSFLSDFPLNLWLVPSCSQLSLLYFLYPLTAIWWYRVIAKHRTLLSVVDAFLYITSLSTLRLLFLGNLHYYFQYFWEQAPRKWMIRYKESHLWGSRHITPMKLHALSLHHLNA